MKIILIPVMLALTVSCGVAKSPPRAVLQPLSLAEHMAEQLRSRTNGGDFNFISKTGQVFLAAEPQLKNNFWLRDVTNILATSVALYQPFWSPGQPSPWVVGACLSPISLRHCIATTHVTGRSLDTHLWLLPDGSLYTNSIIASTNLGGDLTICLMAKTTNVFHRKTGPAAARAGVAVSRGLHLVGGVEFGAAAARHRGTQIAGLGD
jgi:hypothetical protein